MLYATTSATGFAIPVYGAPAATTSSPAPTAGHALIPSRSLVLTSVRPFDAEKTERRPSYVGTTTASRIAVAQPNGAEASCLRQTVLPVVESSAYSAPLPSAGSRANAFGVVIALSREQSSTTGMKSRCF